MTGPTTVGSIDAKLGIDKSEWDRKATEVKAEAKEIGSLDPTIKVDANVAGALAKLGAVARAERDLDVAYQRSAISQQKLDTVTKKWGDDSVQAAAARLTLTRALNSEQDAERKLTSARGGETDATDRNTDSVNRNNQALHGRRALIANLIAASPAIVAAAAPIGAAAIGLGVAFGVMAGAGVAAFAGIKRAMADGNSMGQAYGSGLRDLKIDLNSLADTAAIQMLGSFKSVVGDINARMPFLTQLIGDGSAALGRMGGAALSGVLTGLERMNPLIQEGTVGLDRFVSWLSAMPSSNGFTSFVDYAVANLPSVMTLIENLVTTVGHIFAAFAPLGPVVIGFLNGFTTALNALPLPVLAGVVTTVTSLGIALRIAGSPIFATQITAVGTALAGVGISANLAIPVVGILLAAIAGLAIAGASAAASQQQATVVVQDYTQALRDDNDALGVNVRATAAKALQDAGAYDAALKMGISQKLLTDDLLGVAGAHEQVEAKMAATQKAIHQATADAVGYANAQAGTHVSTDGLGTALSTVSGALDVNNQQIQKAVAASKNIAAANELNTGVTAANAAALGMTTAAYAAAVAAQDQSRASTDAATASMQLQNDAAGLLKNSLDLLNGKSISAAQAQNAFDSSLANMGDHVSATGKKITFTTTSINDMSSASVQLRGQLNGQIQNLQNVVAANGGLSNSTGKAREQMIKMRQQIIDNAVAHGVDRAAVTAYIDGLMKIPKKIPPTKLDVENAAALAKVKALKDYIASLQGKTVWITSHVDSIYSETHTSNGVGGRGGQTKSEGGPIYRANGGPVYLANGGFSRGPMGTDTIPAWLTEGEHVMKRSSAQSLGAPALKYMNDTGKLPPSGGQNITVYVTNPFTGEQVRAVVHSVATNAAGKVLESAVHDAKNRRS